MQENFKWKERDYRIERGHASALRKAWKKNSKRVLYKGQEFESIRAFSKHLGISYTKAVGMVKDGKAKKIPS